MKKKQQFKLLIRSQLIIATCLILAAGLVGVGVWKLAGSYESLTWRLIDSAWESFSVSIRSAGLTSLMLGLSWWGHDVTLWLWVILGGWFAREKNYLALGLVVVLALGGIGLGLTMKSVVDRERPVDEALIVESQQSFPSNHALQNTILYLTIVYFLYHKSYKFWWSMLNVFLAILIIFGISFSRIYLGVHYFSDVLGGICLGLAYMWLILGLVKLFWVGRWLALDRRK